MRLRQGWARRDAGAGTRRPAPAAAAVEVRRDRQPVAHRVAEAILAPLETDPSYLPAPPFRLGGFAADGTPIEAMRFRRGRFEAGWSDPPPRPMRRLAGRHVYGGVLFGHFGHFLVESLARCWYLRANPGLPVLWHWWAPRVLGTWLRDLVAMLGLGRTFVPITEPLAVEELIVPEAGLVAGRYAYEAQARALDLWPCGDPVAGRRAWMSRSRLPEGCARFAGEAEVEASLAEAGWTILHPETMPIAAQLAAFAEAETIAGFEGSALHTAILCGGLRGELRIVPRAPGRIAPNYTLIAAAKGFRQTLVPARLRLVTEAARRSEYAIEDPGALVEALRAG